VVQKENAKHQYSPAVQTFVDDVNAAW